MRFENLEKLFRMARQKSKKGTFQATLEMKATIGVKDSELEQVMAALGFSAVENGDVRKFRQKLRQPKPKKRSRRRKNSNVKAVMKSVASAAFLGGLHSSRLHCDIQLSLSAGMLR